MRYRILLCQLEVKPINPYNGMVHTMTKIIHEKYASIKELMEGVVVHQLGAEKPTEIEVWGFIEILSLKELSPAEKDFVWNVGWSVISTWSKHRNDSPLINKMLARIAETITPFKPEV